MDKQGYDVEARHLSVIHNWRRACDERGLCSDLRSQFNDNLKTYILDELMPWHENSDLSFLEVNRYDNFYACCYILHNFTDPSIGLGVSVEKL